MVDDKCIPVFDDGARRDMLRAQSEEEAIYVSEYNSRVTVVGDESKEEWILAENCYGLDWMR